MLFQASQLRIINIATEYIDSYGVRRYIRNLLGVMPDAKKSHLECEGWFEDRARGGNHGSQNADEKLKRRKIAGSRKQVLHLRQKFSLCRQQKMFVPGVEFEFLFRRSSTSNKQQAIRLESTAQNSRCGAAKSTPRFTPLY